MAITSMKGNKDNSSRKFSGGGRRPDYLGLNRKEAKERNEKRAKLTAKEQLAVLDIRCGKEQGASRERARLLKALETENKTPKQVTNKQPVAETQVRGTKAKDRREAERAVARSSK